MCSFNLSRISSAVSIFARRTCRAFICLENAICGIERVDIRHRITGKERTRRKRCDALISASMLNIDPSLNVNGDQRIRSVSSPIPPRVIFSYPRSQVPISSCHRFLDVLFSKTESPYLVFIFRDFSVKCIIYRKKN